MEKILFIVNPIAGGGRTRSLIPMIDEKMQEKEVDYKIVLTSGPKDATLLAREYLDRGYEKIVAVGGDGTVNEVALGVVDYGRGSLAIIPSGTGNDLARSLNIPQEADKAIDLILNGQEKSIDIGAVNDKFFFNIASIGFDAETVKTNEKVKHKVKSGLSYIISLFITLFKYKDIKVELEIDDFITSSEILLIAVGNGKYYGGGVKILPMADVEDGYFHVCLVKKIPKIKLLFFLPTIVNGSHVKVKKYVKIYKAKEIKVKTNVNSYLNIDGELRNLNKETHFSILSKRLKVIANN
ncbi:MAG: diacylglycerol kinase family lipid kinase [Tissierellia bacterium]|nr:diacylglycerol kinase family lipid kinase [Tissierellia bacterium]